MRTRPYAAAAALMLVPLAACSTTARADSATQSYEVRQPISTLVVEARNAMVRIETGEGAVAVEETLRFSDRQPATSHRVDAGRLLLTDHGCGAGTDLRCAVEYRIRVPQATAAQITADAGAIDVRGLGGRLSVSTRAGAVRAEQLTSDDVSVSTDAGATTLHFLEAPANVRSRSEQGAVEIRVPAEPSYAVDVSTATGRSEVSVTRNPASAHRISVQTKAGLVGVAPLAQPSRG